MTHSNSSGYGRRRSPATLEDLVLASLSRKPLLEQYQGTTVAAFLENTVKESSDVSSIYRIVQHGRVLDEVAAVPNAVRRYGVVAVRPTDATNFEREVRARLGQRAWLLERLGTQPFKLTVRFPAAMSIEEFVDHVASILPLFDVDLADYAIDDLHRLVFFALFPSGTIRGISVSVADRERTRIVIADPLDLLDPDDSDERIDCGVLVELQMAGFTTIP